jgi:hypothetical protein
VDYIIENDKQTFDSDCISKLYELQDRELEKERQSIRAQREREVKIREAREILKGELEKARVGDKGQRCKNKVAKR